MKVKGKILIEFWKVLNRYIRFYIEFEGINGDFFALSNLWILVRILYCYVLMIFYKYCHYIMAHGSMLVYSKVKHKISEENAFFSHGKLCRNSKNLRFFSSFSFWLKYNQYSQWQSQFLHYHWNRNAEQNHLYQNWKQICAYQLYFCYSRYCCMGLGDVYVKSWVSLSLKSSANIKPFPPLLCPLLWINEIIVDNNTF